LRYAADRVQSLYEEVLRGEVKGVGGRPEAELRPAVWDRDAETVLAPGVVPQVLRRQPPAQRPELFDFTPRAKDVALAGARR
jgi:hypothetical protein